MHVAFRLYAQELRLAEIHPREAQVESGLKSALRKRVHLVDDELPRVHGLLRHAQHGLGPQRVEVRAIDAQQDVGADRRDVLLLCAGPELLRLHEIARATEVRDQLGGREAEREAIEDRRVIQRPGRDARVVGGRRAGNTAEQRGPVRGLRFADGLLHGLRRSLCGEHSGVAGQRALLGVSQRQSRRRRLRVFVAAAARAATASVVRRLPIIASRSRQPPAGRRSGRPPGR